VTAAVPAGPLVAVRDLSVIFPVEGGAVRAVDGIGYDIAPRRTLGVVGESGSGKSVAALALLRLIAPPGRIAAGSIRLGELDLLALDEEEMRRVRGARLAMIFQEPMTALNPVFTVGEQIAEVLRLHRGLGERAALDEAVGMLERVGIPAPAARARDYPHQLSGGMRQRAMIAIALAGRPELLIADEPTTALDVTIQAQILDLMLDLQDGFGMAVLFISHNLAVVSEVADDIMVMYAGRIVERAPAGALIAQPLHPYTRGLIAAVPRLAARDGGAPGALHAIPGAVPNPLALPPGCRFSDRCPLADQGCRAAEPALVDVGGGRQVACFKAKP
jgi:oligopeptide/dipeptide ABC transporter ATP-binding protein